MDWANDYDVVASRAVEPFLYRAPHPENMVPMPFQHAAVEYRLGRKNGLYGDAPGLGKTAECIMYANATGSRSNLAVVPASLRGNWEREIWRWSTLENVSTYPVYKAKDGVSLKHDWVIVSYDMLRNPGILDALMDRKWDHLFLDEAHFLKDPGGNQRTKVICAPDLLPSVVGDITMASGTILPNQPKECYNACRLLDWSCIDKASLNDFINYYYDKGEGFIRRMVVENGVRKSKVQFSTTVRNVPRNLDDLQWRLRKHIMVRRLKDQVLPQLPEKRWHPFPIEVNSAIRAALKHPGWRQAERFYEMDPHAFDAGIPVDGAISTARRLLGEAKAPSVANYIDDLIDSGVGKLVVGAWHHSVLDYFQERLAKHGLVFMGAGMSPQKQQAAVDSFQHGPCKIILGQKKVMGLGHTLTAAQDVVDAEPDWVPGVNDQFLDRVHRIGQKGSYVIGHLPVVPNSLDERILATAIEKDISIHNALDRLY